MRCIDCPRPNDRRNRSIPHTLLVSSVLAILGCDSGHAPERPRLTVRPASEVAHTIDTLPGAYTRVMRPAEFHDSLLIFPDLGEGVMWRVRIGSERRELFGQRGNGPGEYPRPFWALKVHTDSVAVVQGFASSPVAIIDVASGRGRTVRFDVSMPDNEAPFRVASSAPFVQYADTLGNLYAAASSAPRGRDGGPEGGSADARGVVVPLVRLRWRDGASARAGWVPPPNWAGTDPESGRASAGLGPYSPFSGWLALTDGRIVVADGSTYEIAVRRPDGSIERRSVVPHPSIRVSEAGFAAYLESASNAQNALTRRMLIGANVNAPVPRPARELPKAPAFLPPLAFTLQSVRIMHESANVLWVPVNAEDPPVREVWELLRLSTLEPLCRIGMAMNERLLLVTKNGAYASALDTLDLERVVRYQGIADRCEEGASR